MLSSSDCHLGFRLENSQRQCVRQIDTCPNSCTNTELVQLCLTAPRALVEAKSVTYRNIYCGLCNHGRDIGFKCGFWGFLGAVATGLFSLSLIFDVNPDHGVVIQFIEVKCKESSPRIPGGIQCGQVVCPVGYIQTGKGCSKGKVEIETNVISKFHIGIEAPTICNQTYNPGALIEELQTAFISASKRHLNVSKTNIHIKMTHICLLTSNYSFDVFVTIKSHEDQSQNISVLLQNIGVMTVWNVFMDIYLATNTSDNAIWIVSGNITLSSQNIRHPECDEFFQITYSNAFQNVLSQRENTTFDFHKRHFNGFNSSVPICMMNENQKKTTKVPEGLGYVTFVFSTASLLCFALRLILQAFYRPYHTSPGKMQFQLSLALALANVLLLTSPLADNIPHLCAIMAALKHAYFISSFCWMTCISADTWRIFRPSNIGINNNDPIFKISVITWASPMTFSSPVFALDYIDIELSISPRFGGAICWFTNWIFFISYVFHYSSRCEHNHERDFLYFGLDIAKSKS